MKKLLILVVLLGTLILSGCGDGTTGNIIKTDPIKICKNVSIPYEAQEQYIKTEYYTESVPYTDQECQDKTLVYSITNFILTASTCNNQVVECHSTFLGVCTDSTTYCTDRTVTCSLDINNMDTERGKWNIRFQFFKSGNTAIDDDNSEIAWLYPQSTETLVSNGRILSKELIDTEYSCRYILVSEPTKQICKDVIKYKDVQRERQVTDYRTTTKYRQEEQCS